MVQAYQQPPASKSHNFSSPEARRQAYLDDLFDAYIRQKLEEPKESKWYERGKEPTPEETKRWLVWLAKRLKDKKQTEFLIEKMQPTWLEQSYQKWLYRLAIWLIVVPIVVKIVGGLVVGLIFMLSKEIRLTESFNFSWQNIINNWRKIIIGLSGGLMFGLIVGLIDGLRFGLIIGLVLGLMFGLIVGLRTDIKNRKIPNQGILESAINGVIIAMITTLVWAFACKLVLLLLRSSVNLVDVIILGLNLGFIVGFIFGGIPVIQHCVLRFILWQIGSSPRSYKHFLGYASERGFILQVGGRYRFIHDLLREHFAKMG